MEWVVLGLSASLLAGRTAGGDNQLLPGPVQHTSMKTQDHMALMVPLGQQVFQPGSHTLYWRLVQMPALGAMPGAYPWT